MKKVKLKQYFSLFLPSASGMVFYVFLAALAIVLNQFDSIKNHLQLPRSLELARIVAGWANHLLMTLIGQSRTETLVVALFWGLVGLAVYVFLRGLLRIITELDDDLVARRYVWPKWSDRYHPLVVLGQQVAFRLFALIMLVLVIDGPLAAVIRGPILVGFLGPNLVLQYTVWFLASLLVWHVAVILARLVASRPRLFG